MLLHIPGWPQGVTQAYSLGDVIKYIGMNRIEKAFYGFQIAWDIDGVSARPEIPVLEIMNERLGTDYRPEDIRHWYWVSETVQEITGNSALAQELESNWFKPEVLGRAPPDKGTLFVVRFCHFLHFNQIFVTTRLPECSEATCEWFRQYLPWVVTEGLLHIRRDTQEKGDDFKMKKAIEVGADIFFEDNGETIQDFLARRISDPRLVNRPWNEDFFGNLDERRVYNWFGMFRAIAGNFSRKLR